MKYLSRKQLIVLAVLIVVVGALLLLAERSVYIDPFEKNNLVPPSNITTGQESLVGSDSQPQGQMSSLLESKSFVIRPGQSPLSYDEAIKLYQNNILEFNENCQLATATRSFHLNNEVMIDNRSSKANTFFVGKNFVSIAPYDFAFMILKEKGTDIPVSCVDHKNVASLSVQ